MDGAEEWWEPFRRMSDEQWELEVERFVTLCGAARPFAVRTANMIRREGYRSPEEAYAALGRTGVLEWRNAGEKTVGLIQEVIRRQMEIDWLRGGAL